MGECGWDFQWVRLKIRLARRMPQGMDDAIENKKQ